MHSSKPEQSFKILLHSGGGDLVPKLCLTKRDSHVVYKSLIIPKDYD